MSVSTKETILSILCLCRRAGKELTTFDDPGTTGIPDPAAFTNTNPAFVPETVFDERLDQITTESITRRRIASDFPYLLIKSYTPFKIVGYVLLILRNAPLALRSVPTCGAGT